VKNKQFIKLLKETKSKLSKSEHAKKTYQNQVKFINMLLVREDYCAGTKRDMEQIMRTGITAEGALMYMIGVWLATKGFMKAVEVNKNEGKRVQVSNAQG